MTHGQKNIKLGVNEFSPLFPQFFFNFLNIS